jgi:hypothetical protein
MVLPYRVVDGAQTTIVGIRHHDAAPECTPGHRDVGRKATHQNFDTAKSRRRGLGALVNT